MDLNAAAAAGAETSASGMALTPLRLPVEIIYDGSIERELSPERAPSLRHLNWPDSPEPQRALAVMPRTASAISIDIIFDDAVRPPHSS